MRKIWTILILMVAGVETGFLQVPEKIDFQAVARNLDGTLIMDQPVHIRITILAGSLPGTPVYQETHAITTDAYGHFLLAIGGGMPVTSSFATIDWSDGPHFVQVAMAANGGSQFQELGTLELMSVPYALYAKYAENVDDADADPTNELQQLQVQGEILSLTGGNQVQLPDASTQNELQQLQLSGDLLSISQGNVVQLPNRSAGWEQEGTSVFQLANRVGIGLDKPPYALSIYQADKAYMSFHTSVSGSGTSDGLLLGLDKLSNSALLWNRELGDIRLGIGSETILYLNQFGRVGVGTEGPIEKLEVSSSTDNVGLRIRSGNKKTARLSLMENNDGQNYGFTWQYDGNNDVLQLRSHGFRNDAANALITVNANGWMGIGTGSPLTALNLHGSDGDYAIFSVSHADYPNKRLYAGVDRGYPFLDVDGNPLLIRAEDHLALAIDNQTRYVGIGTDQPLVHLDVRGNAEVSDNLTVKQDLMVGDQASFTGSVSIGKGISFNQIIEISGTTGSALNYVNIPYPEGYTWDNTRVLSVEVKKENTRWVQLGGDDNSLVRISVFLYSNIIRLYYPPSNDYESKPYRILLMRVGN